MRRITASSYAARRLGHAAVHSRAGWRAKHPDFSPASRVSISELLAGGAMRSPPRGDLEYDVATGDAFHVAYSRIGTQAEEVPG